MPRPLIATIHTAAMQHNLQVARACAPHAKVWAVVKANAYGHGLARGLRAFAEADGLALVEVDGAQRLREMGWQKRILLLEGFFKQEDLPLLAGQRIDTAVHCIEQIEMLEQFPAVAAIDVHLKMNSGMNRLGFAPSAFASTYARLRAVPAVRSIILMTHFANADDAVNPRLLLSEQIHRFDAASAELPGERSLSNSAAVLMHGDAISDWIRPGIMLYGATPGGKSAGEFGLQAAMTLSSEIIGVQNILAGDAVGYGSSFVADRPMKIGVAACGYADGYPRHAPNGTPVIVDGVRTQLVGRVSMDMLTIDLTPVPHSRVGSKVTLWGADLPIDDVARAAGTIGYELMCALAPRVQVVEQ